MTIRRRRECRACGRRFTTFERAGPPGLQVLKRDGVREPFDRAKLVAGVLKAIKNRPVAPADVELLADQVEDRLRDRGPRVTSQQVGIEVLGHLARLDQVAYMRFASVYKEFQEITDFEREVVALQKRAPAKQHAP